MTLQPRVASFLHWYLTYAEVTETHLCVLFQKAKST